MWTQKYSKYEALKYPKFESVKFKKNQDGNSNPSLPLVNPTRHGQWESLIWTVVWVKLMKALSQKSAER